MMTDIYPNLEPNHLVQEQEDGLKIVICPFSAEDGNFYETPWSASAEAWEINCLFCEYLNGALHHAGPLHGDNPELHEKVKRF